MAIKILIADDQKKIRKVLRDLIEREKNMEVIGEAEDGQTVIRMSKKLKPDIVLMDIVMPGLSGLEATRQIKKKFPQIKIIAFSIFSDKALIREMLQSGASGYLLKEDMADEWLKAVKTVRRGKIYFSQRLADKKI